MVHSSRAGAVAAVLLPLLSGCAAAPPAPRSSAEARPRAPTAARFTRLAAAGYSPVRYLVELDLGPARTKEPTTMPDLATLPADPGPLPFPAPFVVEPAPKGPRSSPLKGGLFNPIPGGVMAGYVGDTGLDIAASEKPVFAIGAGRLDYSEAGHTRWVGPKDTPYCVRLELDTKIPWKGKHQITHVYYAHLSALERVQKEGATPRAHVDGGEKLGVSGVANGLPHLHLGLLLDGDVSQESWATILREGEVREALGGYKNGDRI